MWAVWKCIHHRNELQVPAANLLQKTVHLRGMVGIHSIDNAQRVELRTVSLQAPNAAEHVVETAATSFIDAKAIM